MDDAQRFLGLRVLEHVRGRVREKEKEKRDVFESHDDEGERSKV